MMAMKSFWRPGVRVALLLFLGTCLHAGQLPGAGSETDAKEVREIFMQWSTCLKQAQKECVLSWMWNSPDLQVITAPAEIVRGWQGLSKKLDQLVAQPDLEYKVESATPLAAGQVTLLYSLSSTKDSSPLKKLLGSMLWMKKPEGWRCTQAHLAQSLDGKPLLPALPTLDELNLPPLPTLPPSSSLAPPEKKSNSRKPAKAKSTGNVEDSESVPSTTLPGNVL